jgi:hypothetical protein
MEAGQPVSPGRSSFRGVSLIILIAALVVLAATAGLAAGQAGSVSDVTYTLDADFNKGTMVNVNHDAPNGNQLQLNTETSTFPFIWVALSVRCTIAKINTETGAILGEYRTIADDADCNQSSRTTVALDGSVWVGHRGEGGATHVGLVDSNQCLDRNGNGTIETSSGYGDVKPWTGSTSNVANAQDECIRHHVDTDSIFSGGGDTRHMSIDANNNLWIGSNNSGGEFIRVNGSTGVVETAVKDLDCGGYGGLIDGNGVIWSAAGSLLRWDPNAPDSATNPQCIDTGHSVYGVAVDPNGFIWTTELGSGEVMKTSPDGATHQGPFPYGGGGAQGLAAAPNGDIWISAGLFCSSNCTIGHLKNNGEFVGAVPNPTGAGSTGVSVDAAGKVWTANLRSNTATRIDPNAGPLGPDGVTHVGAVDLTVNFPAGPDGRPQPEPYNYSDMTGAQLLAATAPQGTWTVVQDGGAAGTQWSKIRWNTEAQGSVPAGTQIVVEARAADTQAGLGSQPFAAVTNDGQLSLTGRFVEVRATLRPSSDGTSPVLSDIRVCEAGGCQAAAQTPASERPAAQVRRPTARVSGVPGSCVRGGFNTRIRIRAAGELRSVRVTLNGRRIMTTRKKSFSVRIPGRTLRSGRYRLRVVATDSLGRTVRISRSFRRCARPAQQRELPTFTG